MPNVELFPATRLDEAVTTVLNPEVDLVVVRNLVDVSDGILKNIQALDERMSEYTWQIQEWWADWVLDDMSNQVRAHRTYSPTTGVPPHIDIPPFVGFVASVNLDEKGLSRQFYASRQGVPKFTEYYSDRAHRDKETFNRSAERQLIVDDDWITINAGDAALFGALPYLAVHSSRGETLQFNLFTWKAKEIQPKPKIEYPKSI
jgi:hypothetical protein